mmetsp:Transcript_3036/g.11308  ORF Transcript_3036/g.11308 Transcript_3036/m.11308 type:complete len:247 (-) Transcript_3036:963-1703(-)
MRDSRVSIGGCRDGGAGYARRDDATRGEPVPGDAPKDRVRRRGEAEETIRGAGPAPRRLAVRAQARARVRRTLGQDLHRVHPAGVRGGRREADLRDGGRGEGGQDSPKSRRRKAQGERVRHVRRHRGDGAGDSLHRQQVHAHRTGAPAAETNLHEVRQAIYEKYAAAAADGVPTADGVSATLLPPPAGVRTLFPASPAGVRAVPAAGVRAVPAAGPGAAGTDPSAAANVAARVWRRRAAVNRVGGE